MLLSLSSSKYAIMVSNVASAICSYSRLVSLSEDSEFHRTLLSSATGTCQDLLEALPMPGKEGEDRLDTMGLEIKEEEMVIEIQRFRLS